jgi:L-asparaginase
MKLLLVHTGGTLMMSGGEPSPLVPDVYKSDLLGELPVLRKIADVDTRILFNLDSGDMQPHHWVELAAAIHEELPRYDGVVVVHGTDTMAYTASALAFLLEELDRPVVLTGAQRPLASVRTDARANLVDAFEIATLGIPEVGVAFDSRFYRGCRTTKLDAWGLSAFGSPTCPPLVELGLGVSVAPHALARRPRATFDGRIELKVMAVRVFPGLDPRFLVGALDGGTRGLVLEAYGAGNVPHHENSLVPVVEEAARRDVPVVIASQCPRGTVDLARYDGSAAAERAGAIGAHDMTAEAALAKLMIALGRAPGEKIPAARDAFARAVVGEWG